MNHPDISTTTEIAGLLARNCAVAIGVSGGKDSVACALLVDRYLQQIGHTGPKLLIHSDLGRVEWKDSLPSCERLAAKIGWELAVVRRKAGDMLARWQRRWANNVARYVNLECVKLILPWSTPAMRFCTSELKTAIIASELKRRFQREHILNVTGIRRQESANRAKAPVSANMPKLERAGYLGLTWNAIIDLQIEQVFAVVADSGLQLHEAYTAYHSSRVSCCFCIMGSRDDLEAASTCTDNHDVYRDMVSLEAESSFAFQGNRWLADVAPHLLGDELKTKAQDAKRRAAQRELLESSIPKHLLFEKGWPNVMPTPAEAELLAGIRRSVAGLVGISAKYLTGPDVLARYAELMRLKEIAA